MTKRALAAAAVLAALSALPAAAGAQSFILDTGTPGATTASTLNASNWYAAEFTITSTEDVSLLSAYLTIGAGAVGNTFTFDIYNNSSFINQTAANRDLVATAQGTYEGNGWNSTAVSNVSLAPGTYWFALQVGSSGDTPGLDLPNETGTGTGSAPAYDGNFAVGTGTNPKYEISSADPIGLEITASAVPEPSSLLLGVAGLVGVLAMVRRRGD